MNDQLKEFMADVAEKFQEEFGNDYERNVILKGQPVEDRIAHRYKWANDFAKGSVLDIGCSTGFGSQFLTKALIYIGIDKDQASIDIAKMNFGSGSNVFMQRDIDPYNIDIKSLGYFTTIIAFEFLEHILTGKEVAQELKNHCDILLCSVPYDEEPGFWGPHHVLHNLTTVDFPGFEIDLSAVKETGLMLMKWEKK